MHKSLQLLLYRPHSQRSAWESINSDCYFREHGTKLHRGIQSVFQSCLIILSLYILLKISLILSRLGRRSINRKYECNTKTSNSLLLNFLVVWHYRQFSKSYIFDTTLLFVYAIQKHWTVKLNCEQKVLEIQKENLKNFTSCFIKKNNFLIINKVVPKI